MFGAHLQRIENELCTLVMRDRQLRANRPASEKSESPINVIERRLRVSAQFVCGVCSYKL